ncbi:MAG TPA: TfoX/Sxy family protein [Candidatus Dormibacteraeota bacterium]|jgi:TfoX/Sxy family transcriptional regulator of competence genes
MSPMTMPKPSEQAKAAFQKLVPPDPNVTTRPMFGNLAGFVNGNMFCRLLGEDLFVRVSDEDQAKVRKQGGRAFEPMPGRAMTGYVVVPVGWQKKPDATRTWIVTALAWSRILPAKDKSKSSKKAAPKSAAPRKAVPARRPR